MICRCSWHKYHKWYFKILSKITYNNFQTSLVVFMPNITTNHAITYTNTSTVLIGFEMSSKLSVILLTVSNSIFTPHRSFYQRIVFSCCWPTKTSQKKTAQSHIFYLGIFCVVCHDLNQWSSVKVWAYIRIEMD